MNKKTLQKKASLLLKQYKAMMSEQRGYENEDWHCINVKRRDDYVNINKLINKQPSKYSEQLKEKFNDSAINSEYGIYNNWLESLWEQLNNELEDIVEITRGCKDEKKIEFEFIRTEHWAGCNEMILSLGRSGGWACFQDTMDDVEDSLIAIIDWDIKEMSNYGIDVDCKNKPLDDVVIKLNNIEKMINEVVFIKNYIKNFNAGANFTDEITFRINEEIDALKMKNKSIAEDKGRLIQDLMAEINTIQARLDAFKRYKELKTGVQRHLTGITKILKAYKD